MFSVVSSTVDAPDTAWVGDITYLWTAEGWLYLAVLVGSVLPSGGWLGVEHADLGQELAPCGLGQSPLRKGS